MNATETVYGIELKSAGFAAGTHDVAIVEDVAYYTHDFGGYIVGSRRARRVDFGGNPHSDWRDAPASTAGLAAPLGRGSIPCRIEYSEPEVVFA